MDFDGIERYSTYRQNPYNSWGGVQPLYFPISLTLKRQANPPDWLYSYNRYQGKHIL
ncbi:hypothetical protein Cycma_1746 [Cyclobacterium marinum DSM 745]|uniref:Uncharacterized protein n=1 Tax=Cyclobacterium marinum (strain ATCC 25205 / DSM 745 / LMG 13164 / NCIMB 1802) TaxID=880070 RepID=G0IVV5_CYCMS|nr:hypothetical protein Cycma_1746 [Cyclobacterium marinum DSM 745]